MAQSLALHTNFLSLQNNNDHVKGCQNNPSNPFIHPCTGPDVALNNGAVPDVSLNLVSHGMGARVGCKTDLNDART